MNCLSTPTLKGFTQKLHPQRGVSLIMVMLVLMMVALTAVSASRSSLFNESITGNEADYNRALAAAEAMIREGQMDVLGPAVSGCMPAVCRPQGNDLIPTLAAPFFPYDLDSVKELQTTLLDTCRKGICAPTNFSTTGLPANFWLNEATLQANIPGAATYGEFTGANPQTAGNPILTTLPRRAWYWVEVFPYDTDSCTASSNAGGLSAFCNQIPTIQRPFIVRISAVARGMRPGTIAGIQTLFVPDPNN